MNSVYNSRNLVLVSNRMKVCRTLKVYNSRNLVLVSNFFGDDAEKVSTTVEI